MKILNLNYIDYQGWFHEGHEMDVDYSGQCRDNKYDSCVIEEDIQTMQMYSVYKVIKFENVPLL